MNIQDRDVLKAISNTFNSSSSYDEFLVRLDLVGIDLDYAQHIYTSYFTNMLKFNCCICWCTNGMVDFKKLFKIHSIALPSEFVDGLDSIHQIKAYVNEKEIVVYANVDFDSIDVQINVEEEIISTLLNMLATECRIYRRKGIGYYGKV